MSRVTDLIRPDDIRSGVVTPPSRLAEVALYRIPENENDFQYLKENFPDILHYIAEGLVIPPEVVQEAIERIEAHDQENHADGAGK